MSSVLGAMIFMQILPNSQTKKNCHIFEIVFPDEKNLLGFKNTN